MPNPLTTRKALEGSCVLCQGGNVNVCRDHIAAAANQVGLLTVDEERAQIADLVETWDFEHVPAFKARRALARAIRLRGTKVPDKDAS